MLDPLLILVVVAAANAGTVALACGARPELGFSWGWDDNWSLGFSRPHPTHFTSIK